MKYCAIDLPWHDVVVDAVGIIDASLSDPSGLERNEGELEQSRDALHQAAVEFMAYHGEHDNDHIDVVLLDVLAYLNNGLRSKPLGRWHFEQAHELLVGLRDMAMPY